MRDAKAERLAHYREVRIATQAPHRDAADKHNYGYAKTKPLNDGRKFVIL